MEEASQNRALRYLGAKTGASLLTSPIISISGCKHDSVFIQMKQGAFGSFASQLKANLKATQTGALLQQEGEGLQSDREEVGAKPGQVI